MLVRFWIDKVVHTIEGETDLAFSENIEEKFHGLGWHVEHVDDAKEAVADTAKTIELEAEEMTEKAKDKAKS